MTSRSEPDPLGAPAEGRSREAARDEAQGAAPGPAQVHALPTDLVVARYARLARTIIARRQARRLLLPHGMLVDVAWDLLLQLLAHRAEPGPATTDVLAAGAGLSPTVAVRWLSLLQADGLVEYREPGWSLSAAFLPRMIAHFRDHYPDAV